MPEHLLFHVWRLDEHGKMRLSCGESDADATITAEWGSEAQRGFLVSEMLAYVAR